MKRNIISIIVQFVMMFVTVLVLVFGAVIVERLNSINPPAEGESIASIVFKIISITFIVLTIAASIVSFVFGILVKPESNTKLLKATLIAKILMFIEYILLGVLLMLAFVFIAIIMALAQQDEDVARTIIESAAFPVFAVFAFFSASSGIHSFVNVIKLINEGKLQKTGRTIAGLVMIMIPVFELVGAILLLLSAKYQEEPKEKEVLEIKQKI